MKHFSFALLLMTALNVAAQKNMVQVGHLNYGYQLAGVWHYVDSTGHEYAIVGTYHGVSIVNLANPALPVEVATTPGTESIWREIKVWDHYAYVSTEGVDTNNVLNGIQIIDLSTLPNPVAYKFYTGDGAIAGQLTRAHTVTVSNGYLYINGSQLLGKGSLICSLADPWNPQYVGNYANNYVHDCVVKNDTMWTSEIYMGQFAIVDVTNKANPVLLQTQSTPGLFNHNGWHSDDGKTFFTTDEKSFAPLGSFDVSDISNIKLLDTYLSETAPQGEVHNVRVLNDFLLCANYASHITIVDAARPSNLIETGYAPQGSTFLSWDVDPYFPSGLVVATDMQSGLFVYNVSYVRACYLEGTITDSVTNAPLKDAMAAILTTPSYDSSDVAGDYKTGYADAGVYDVEFSLPGYIKKTISNVSLTNGVVTTLDVALVPISFGVVANDPCLGSGINYNADDHSITIQLSDCNAPSELQFELCDNLGRIMLSQKINGNPVAVPSRINNGVYSYTLKTINNQSLIATGKLVLTR